MGVSVGGPHISGPRGIGVYGCRTLVKPTLAQQFGGQLSQLSQLPVESVQLAFFSTGSLNWLGANWTGYSAN